MDRRGFLKKIGLSAAALTIPKLNYGMAGPTKRPNLLFVFPDQMRKHALGFINEDPVITPNLDKFARESMVFTNAISSNPICTPFRAMLLTGRHSISIGMVSNCQPGLNQQ
jgi:arylsulfatase A-like enzyme